MGLAGGQAKTHLFVFLCPGPLGSLLPSHQATIPAHLTWVCPDSAVSVTGIAYIGNLLLNLHSDMDY